MNITLRHTPPEFEKMSGVLLKFAEPLLDRSAPIDELRGALHFAMLIWNYSLLPAEARERGLPKGFTKDLWQETVAQQLLERKAQLFPNNRRMLCDLQVFKDDGHLRVSVVSLAPPESPRDEIR
ncbi:MAG: hypothetical protein JO015_14785 [Verrucomicrobia bacterium]|nr:hypothetical protein [Verrucomicrobiota bacterium]